MDTSSQKDKEGNMQIAYVEEKVRVVTTVMWMDGSCSKLVRYEKCDGIPSWLMIY